ncbi:MAG: hypothetical protein GY841_10405 [FCB group bacterium]|nr:hypothetical protein [FCB group bacterium]
MAIDNGYCTLAQLKQRLLDMRTYSSDTIAFVNATSKITDTDYGLKQFLDADIIQIAGSTNNDGYYNVTTGAEAAEIVTTEALVNEAAGAVVTIVQAADPVDDATLEQCIEAASRWIDAEAGRVFYSIMETRYFTPAYSDMLFIPDLVSVTTLKTDSNGDRTYDQTWAATDYDLLPFSAADTYAEYSYNRIESTPNGDYSFPLIAKGVEINGTWGFEYTPEAIWNACALEAAFLFKAADSPNGVIGSPEVGEVRMAKSHDSRAYALIQKWRRTV